jgi:hypothetical protein
MFMTRHSAGGLSLEICTIMRKKRQQKRRRFVNVSRKIFSIFWRRVNTSSMTQRGKKHCLTWKRNQNSKRYGPHKSAYVHGLGGTRGCFPSAQYRFPRALSFPGLSWIPAFIKVAMMVYSHLIVNRMEV